MYYLGSKSDRKYYFDLDVRVSFQGCLWTEPSLIQLFGLKITNHKFSYGAPSYWRLYPLHRVSTYSGPIDQSGKGVR